jgi:hypothetical protein
MTISDDRLDAFIDAYEHAHGERLMRDEARDAAMRLLALIELLSSAPGSRRSQIEPPAF